MPAGRFGSGDIPAETGVPAAGLGAGRPELRAMTVVGRSIRGGKRVVSAGCGSITDPTAGNCPEVCILSIAAYPIGPGS